jgi:prepilin-type N-terminal cleavage/methylation domain-containing protein
MIELMMKNTTTIKPTIRAWKNANGFTLVEIIAAITLLGIMGIFTTQFITSIAQSTQLTTAQKGLVDDAKLAMEYLIREVRVSTADDNDILYSSTATTAFISFDKFNGYTVDTNKAVIRYDWNSTSKTITRTSGVGGVVTTLAAQVTSFTVAESPSVGSLFFIFTMTLEGPKGENFTLKSGVRPRYTTS